MPRVLEALGFILIPEKKKDVDINRKEREGEGGRERERRQGQAYISVPAAARGSHAIAILEAQQTPAGSFLCCLPGDPCLGLKVSIFPSLMGPGSHQPWRGSLVLFIWARTGVILRLESPPLRRLPRPQNISLWPDNTPFTHLGRSPSSSVLPESRGQPIL